MVALALNQRQADQCLGSGQENPPRLGVFVVQGDGGELPATLLTAPLAASAVLNVSMADRTGNGPPVWACYKGVIRPKTPFMLLRPPIDRVPNPSHLVFQA